MMYPISLLRRLLAPKPPEPEPCSDWNTADDLDAKLALRKAHRVAERSMRGRV